MYFRPGQIMTKFTSKKGKDIVLRIPRLDWEKKYQKFINSIIAENNYIILDTSQTLKDEKKYLRTILEEIKNDTGWCLTAFHKNEIIGNIDLSFHAGRGKHVASFGIAIMDGFREEGIGTKMMEMIFIKADQMGAKIIELRVFANNNRAIKAYKKFGFSEIGRIPRAIYLKGKYIDDVIMYKNL